MDAVLGEALDKVFREAMDGVSGTARSKSNREVQKRKKELGFLKAFLVSGVQAELLREMDLERQIRQVTDDAENALDYYSVQMEAAHLKNRILRNFITSRLSYALRASLSSIRSASLDPIARRVKSYGTLRIKPTHTNQFPTELLNKEDSRVVAKKIVGFDDELETLISSVLEETAELDVIAITGMPGIGKTMLASKVYRDERIRLRMTTLIWVHDISPAELSSRHFCLIVLEQLIKQGMLRYEELVMLLNVPQYSRTNTSCLEILNEISHSVDDDRLICAVRGCLNKSRYFLVVDGVWDEKSLCSIKKALPNNGKVMITSGNDRITEKQPQITSGNDRITEKQPHVMRFLNERESWELLQLEVFGKLDGCPEALRSSGKRIARECDGSPLSIVAVASSLVVGSSTEEAQNLTKDLWKMVSENVSTYIADYGAQHNVFKRVEMSYRKLPEHLQNCLLYLGMFPENYEIPIRTLTRLWIAEGFIQDTGTQTLDNIAEVYLGELIVRNLVVVRKTYPSGPIKTCRLRTLIYGFCKHKALQQDFYQEMKTSPASLTPSCRRLFIYSNLSGLLSSAQKELHVRSILCLNKEEEVILHRKDKSTIHKHFKFLRILECRYINFTKFHTWLTRLKLLRYISISSDDLHVIPETISLLLNLETLVVETRSPSLEIKANIWRMSKLQHLVTKAAIVLAIKGKDGEASNVLQTMTRLAPAHCTEDVFRRAPKLKKLGIRGQLSTLSDAGCMKELQFLESMKLINEAAAADTQLHLNCFPANLKKLTLSGTYMGWESMSVLRMIDGLEILKLKDNAFNRGSSSLSSWNTDSDCFRSLRFLLITTTDLVSWEASDDCLPALKCLVLKNCRELKEIPAMLARRLERLEMENVSESAVESAKEIEQAIASRHGQKKSW